MLALAVTRVKTELPLVGPPMPLIGFLLTTLRHRVFAGELRGQGRAGMLAGQVLRKQLDIRDQGKTPRLG